MLLRQAERWMSENALGEFLRARRGRLTPEAAGLPALGPRRVPGLRREELAVIAGVSSPYYARLEQGRDRHPSPQVLAALGRALGLDAQAFAYMQRLARAEAATRPWPATVETVPPGLAQMIAAWVDQPAVLIGRYRDVLAANPLAQTLNPGFVPGRNLLQHTFLDPEGRRYYLDWEDIAAGAVAGLRAANAEATDDRRLQQLVDELARASGDFRRLWATHDARVRTSGSKRYDNPFVGQITLDYESLSVDAEPGETLFLFHAAPGSPDAASLQVLAGIAGRGEPA
jgi:transcriptional regulator with XRE-family HTH domain